MTFLPKLSSAGRRGDLKADLSTDNQRGYMSRLAMFQGDDTFSVKGRQATLIPSAVGYWPLGKSPCLFHGEQP